MVALLPATHRLAGASSIDLADLAADWFISYPPSPQSALHAKVLNACAEAGFIPRIQYFVSDTSAMASLVANGLGVALVPQTLRSLMIGGLYTKGCDPRRPAQSWRSRIAPIPVTL